MIRLNQRDVSVLQKVRYLLDELLSFTGRYVRGRFRYRKRRGLFRYTGVALFAGLLTFILYASVRSYHEQELVSMYLNEERFEPEVLEDFPTAHGSNPPPIPHILHQVYHDNYIPSNYQQYVRSFRQHHPDWDYFFWTDEQFDELMRDKYPNVRQVTESYTGHLSNIRRADIMRYVIVYEFGGVYADLDYEFLRPLDRATLKYSCIIPPEPFEHSVLKFNAPFYISNAFFMCRAKHPFFKQIIDQLVYYQMMMNILDATGPGFLTSQFMIYNGITELDKKQQGHKSSSPYFYKGHLKEDNIDAVYVPNTQYFMHTLSLSSSAIINIDEYRYRSICLSNPSSRLIRRGCGTYARRLENPRDNRFTFGQHHWGGSYMPLNKLKMRYVSSTDIYHIVTDIRTYKSVGCCLETDYHIMHVLPLLLVNVFFA